MPSSLTFPGVYIEEIPSGVRTIVGVSTSTTAVVGRARKGPTNTPVIITSFGEFDRVFGGLWELSLLSFAVQHYFLNGGAVAIIVRVTRAATAPDDPLTDLTARFTLAGATADLVLDASSPGAWANTLQVAADYQARDPNTEFNLVVSDTSVTPPVQLETLRNLTPDPASP